MTRRPVAVPEFLPRRNLLPFIGIIIITVALVVTLAYPHCHRPFTSPLDITFMSPVAYLPLVHRQYRLPDSRFGVAEHTPLEAELLGLAGADYTSGQWRLPLPGDTAVFLRPTERPHWSTWKLCSWSAANGWYDEQGCRQWVGQNPGMIYVVSNELAVGGNIGDGYWIDATQYSQWYHEARELIKGEDPTATVAPYGPVGQDTAGLLIAVWDSHLAQFGTLLQADFYPVHHYCQPSDGPEWCWTKLTHWIDWLELHRGTHWAGPQDYWLTEWGLPAWAGPIPIEASLNLMEGMAPLLQDNSIGISRHAWWPSCNSGWPDQCTLLIDNSRVTILGRKYLELALTGE